MRAAVPSIEIADDADALRIRRPDGKVHALHAAHRHAMGAKPLPGAIVSALGEQMEVEVGQNRTEPVRITDVTGPAVFPNAQSIDELVRRLSVERHGRFEQPLGPPPLHAEDLVVGDELHIGRRRLHRPDDERGPTACRDRMRPEDRERIVARARCDGIEQLIDGRTRADAHRLHDILLGF